MSFFRACFLKIFRRKRRNPSSSSENKASSDESEQTHETVTTSPVSPPSGLIGTSPAEATGAAALLTNGITSQHSSRQAQLLSNWGREERHIRWKGARNSKSTSDEEDEVDEELKELAKLRERALLFLSSPEGREPDPEGYVTQQQYSFSGFRINGYWVKLIPFVTYRQVKINSLPDTDQNCVYEYTLCQATIQQVRRQYEIHCQRLENIRRKNLLIRNVSKKERRLGNIDYHAWCYITSQFELGRLAPLAERAERAYLEAQMHYDERLCGRIAERGVIRLLERCERILKECDENFVPSDWRSTHSAFRRRWADGQRGWTGLEP